MFKTASCHGRLEDEVDVYSINGNVFIEISHNLDFVLIIAVKNVVTILVYHISGGQ